MTDGRNGGAASVPAVWVGDRIRFSVALLEAWRAEPGRRTAVLRLADVVREDGALVLVLEAEDPPGP